jgi:hypothetical protein
MTFKSIKFSDSPVMRSLQRVALERNLIQPKTIEKSASSDFTPTNNLINDLLKLASGLKEAGFHSYADDLELKIINYKYAKAKEFDPILDQAHPKSTDLENIDHTVKNLLESHLDFVQSVNSKPKGKIANYLLIDKIAQVLKDPTINSDDKSKFPIISLDQAWVSEDGTRCNSTFISQTLESQALSLVKAVNLLNKLKSVSADKRFDPAVSKGIELTMNVLGNLVKDYVGACKTAAAKAKSIETERLKTNSDPLQSKVTFAEVGSSFKSGSLAKVNVGKSNTFLEVVSNITSLKKDLGELIFNRLSPGFDFDEDFMQSIKSQGFSTLEEIKNVLGS